MSEMLQHLLLCYKYGLKQLYYFNTFDGQGEINIDKLVESKPVEEAEYTNQEDCDSCVI
jgi:hypothetical protein